MSTEAPKTEGCGCRFVKSPTASPKRKSSKVKHRKTRSPSKSRSRSTSRTRKAVKKVVRNKSPKAKHHKRTKSIC